MTRDELENLIYERTRRFVDAPVADCIFDLIAAEREACAKVCEETRFPDSYTAIRCAAAIRARGKL